MKFVLASYGTRGDVEPCAALGSELLRRGHEVRMAVAPDLVGFAESAGLAAVPYGLETQAMLTCCSPAWLTSGRPPMSRSTTTFRSPRSITSLRGPTASSCRSCPLGWPTLQ